MRLLQVSGNGPQGLEPPCVAASGSTPGPIRRALLEGPVRLRREPQCRNRAGRAQGADLDATRWQYLNGAADPSLVSPDNWLHDQTLLDRPGNDLIQLKLFHDYPTNIDGYPQLQEYFRTSQVPLLAVWGANDEIFGPDGARAFQRDLPDADIHLLDAGHFALETHLDAIAGYIRGFLGTLPAKS